jgi:hypothetical protein
LDSTAVEASLAVNFLKILAQRLCYMEKGDASKETKKWFFIIKKRGGLFVHSSLDLQQMIHCQIN